MATHLFYDSSRKYKWNVGNVHGTMGNEKFEFNGGIIMCGMTTDL